MVNTKHKIERQEWLKILYSTELIRTNMGIDIDLKIELDIHLQLHPKLNLHLYLDKYLHIHKHMAMPIVD